MFNAAQSRALYLWHQVHTDHMPCGHAHLNNAIFALLFHPNKGIACAPASEPSVPCTFKQRKIEEPITRAQPFFPKNIRNIPYKRV